MSSQIEVSRFLSTSGTPELGPGPRAGVQPEAELNRALNGFFQDSKLTMDRQQLIRALVLLWHDHLDPAHELAQGIDNADGAFVHGIMHRREPDYGNAAYWFRRVGRHAAFPEIAKRVGALAESKANSAVYHQLIRNREWDSFAFIEACKSAAAEPASDPGQSYLREVQRVETESLLDWFCQGR